MAEECYARALDSLMDTDAHHKAINEQAKHAVQAFAAATGGREVPGVDRAARRLSAVRQSGLASLDVLVPLAAASVTAGVGAAVLRLTGWL